MNKITMKEKLKKMMEVNFYIKKENGKIEINLHVGILVLIILFWLMLAK